ncbi:MAG: type II secretion system protein GspD [Alphaproteobacteria bacterium]
MIIGGVHSHYNNAAKVLLLLTAAFALFGCAQATVPGSRNVNIPSPTMADQRPEAVNERPDSVIYLPLGSDVLVPETLDSSPLPTAEVGPFELRSETLAGALQLILADYEIPLAFETNEGMTRTITVANLRGPLDEVVRRVCSLADLYCAFEDNLLVIKDVQTFTVAVPPVGGDNNLVSAVASGIAGITGSSPIVDEATRTIIYEATNRTAKMAERYLQRIRANTALIIFEVYIWEVNLDTANNMGINWEDFGKIGGAVIDIPGAIGATDSSPISIGIPSLNDKSYSAGNVLEFLSTFGAVKTISQPQITVLSGAEASLRAADTINYVSSLTRSVEDGETTTTTETDSVDTGFTLTIASSWDNATIYGDIEIDLDEFRRFEDFDADGTTLRLPETTERELSTQIRIRPGDSLLIGGLVRESDTYDDSGPGFQDALFPTSRGAVTANTELVFLLKPRVIVYTAEAQPAQAKRKSVVVDSNGRHIGSGKSDAPLADEGFPKTSVPFDLLNPAN